MAGGAGRGCAAGHAARAGTDTSGGPLSVIAGSHPLLRRWLFPRLMALQRVSLLSAIEGEPPCRPLPHSMYRRKLRQFVSLTMPAALGSVMVDCVHERDYGHER